jgi:hypothetical protein
MSPQRDDIRSLEIISLNSFSKGNFLERKYKVVFLSWNLTFSPGKNFLPYLKILAPDYYAVCKFVTPTVLLSERFIF